MSNPAERPDDAGALRRSGTPATIAHRGFADVSPENTLGAIGRATALDPAPETIEVDVRTTADGELVVFHDDTPARLTNAPANVRDRPVRELPYETLRTLDVLGTGERIPRLADVFETVPSDFRINVEFKDPGRGDVRFADNLAPAEREAARDRWSGFAQQVLAVVDEYPHEVLISSFFEGAIAAVRDVDPTVPVAWILYESVEDGLAVARRYDCEAIHPPWSMFRGTSLFNEEYTGNEPYEEVDLVEIAREEGREVNAWTVDTWYQATELHRIGVDGIITDSPGLLQYSVSSSSGRRTARATRSPSRASE